MSLLDFFGNEDLTKKKILFIDFHNMAYRNLFVSIDEAPEENQNGFPLWKAKVTQSLFSCIKEFKPTKVIISFDSKSWRKKIYPEYKANRVEAKEKSVIDFEQFLPVLDKYLNDIKEMLTNVYVLRISECESDDVIAVLTKEFSKYIDDELVIISSDRDFLQLQKQKNVKQYDPIQKKFIECVNPEFELEVKILTGDRGDNIPNVRPKLGPKTAEKLLKEGLNELLSDEECKKNYIRNKKLIDLDQIPEEIVERIKTEFNNYTVTPLDSKKLWNQLIQNRITGMAEQIQTYLPELKAIK